MARAVLIAFDKFKHSLTAAEACALVSTVLSRPGNDLICQNFPVADGGEGFVSALATGRPGTWHQSTVSDPLGRPVVASWFLGPDAEGGQCAILEMCSASGLDLVKDQPLQPERASTFGTGQLILEAARAGATKILLGIGGSATNDAGMGMALALGYQFWDANDVPVLPLPELWENVVRISPPHQQAWPSIEVAVDVTNPLLGPDGATMIYGRQKGVTTETQPLLENRLSHLEKMAIRDLGVSTGDFPGAGAAGGMGFGLRSFAKATLRPGFELVAAWTGLEKAMRSADIVITGEGRLDNQSLQGKGPHGVALMAKRLGKPVVAFCGSVETGNEFVSTELASLFSLIIPIMPPGWTVEESMRQGAMLLEQGTENHSEKIARL